MREDLLPDLRECFTSLRVRIDFPLGPFFAEGGEQILDLTPQPLTLGPSADSWTLVLENSNRTGKRIEEYWSPEAPALGAEVYIDLEIRDLQENRYGPFDIFQGVITRIARVMEEEAEFEISYVGEKHRRPIGKKFNKEDYPNLPAENVGQIHPWIWGFVDGFRPYLVDDDQITKLTRAMISTDTKAYVLSTEDFPSTGTIRINDEKMTYIGTGEDIDKGPYFDLGSTSNRGVSGTKVGSHVAGNEVVEVGTLKFVVSEHAIAAANIENVRYVDEDGVEGKLTPDSIDDTGPTIITFNEAPMVEIPSGNHKLKIADVDANNGSTCSNPTNAAGAHTDWTEYNYATIENGQNLNLIRQSSNPVVEPAGDPLRIWLVAEYWKSFTGNGAAVYFDNHLLGNLPDKTNTPDDLKEDEGVHSMSAGFEDEHTHEIDGDHHHVTETVSSERPRSDTGDDNDSTNGKLRKAYDGNWDTYESVKLNRIGAGAVSSMSLMQLANSSLLNINKKIKRINVRFRAMQTDPGTSPILNAIFYIPKSGGTKTITLLSGSSGFTSSAPQMIASGWIDVSADGIYSYDALQAYLNLSLTGGTYYTFNLYNVEFEYELDHENTPDETGYTFEPISAGPFSDLYDQDYTTFRTLTSAARTWTWSTSSRPSSKILKIITTITGGGAGESFTVYFKGYTHAVSPTGDERKTTIDIWDVSAYNGTGADLTDTANCKIYRNGVCTALVDLAIWVQYEDHSTGGITEDTDIGDTDPEGGQYSSLAWFSIESYASTWQDVVNKSAKIAVAGSDFEVKVLRLYFVFEFAPRVKKAVKELLCDVTGRSGGFDDILTDILTDSRLLGLPASRVSIPALANAGAGVYEGMPMDGLALADQVIEEARCHGFWGWGGVFKVKGRVKRSELGDPVDSILWAFTAERSYWDLADLANDITCHYNYDFKKRTMADSVQDEDADSQDKYGKISPYETDLLFIREETEAEAILEFLLSYLTECFEEPMIEHGMRGLNLEPGDLVAIECEGISGKKVEIKEIMPMGLLDPEEVLGVQIRGTKYD